MSVLSHSSLTFKRDGDIATIRGLSEADIAQLKADHTALGAVQSTASLALSGAVLPYEAGKAYSAGSLVIFNSRLYQCVQATSGVEAPTDGAYWALILSLADMASMLLPVGSVMAYAGSGVLDNFLLCDGSAISRTSYSALFGVIGTTYGSGDGSSTFNLPNLADKFIQGSAISGTVKAAGLPNATGRLALRPLSNGNSCAWAGIGAFYDETQTNTTSSIQPASGGNQPWFWHHMDLSRSNAIYNASTTVQPPALTMRYMIKYQ